MTTQTLLDDRYGRARSTRSRLIVWIVVAMVVVLVGGWFAWTTWTSAAESVDADATGYDISDPHAVALTFQFTAPAGAAVACALEAQDTDHGIVGWRVVEYPASESRQRAFTESIPVVSAATTGLVKSCWVP